MFTIDDGLLCILTDVSKSVAEFVSQATAGNTAVGAAGPALPAADADSDSTGGGGGDVGRIGDCDGSDRRSTVGAAVVPGAAAPPSVTVIVPDGSWEHVKAMVKSLVSRAKVKYGNDLGCVRLVDSNVQAHTSPLIEALQKGQGTGRLSTLEACAIFVAELEDAILAHTEDVLGDSRAVGMLTDETEQPQQQHRPVMAAILEHAIVPLAEYTLSQMTVGGPAAAAEGGGRRRGRRSRNTTTLDNICGNCGRIPDA